MSLLPALPVALPLSAAALLAGLRKWLPRFVIDLLAVLTACVNLGICLWLLRSSFFHRIVYWFGDWHPRGEMVIGIGFLIDPVGATLASLAAFLCMLALIFSWGRMESGQNYFQPLMLVFLAAMSGFCFTADLFNLFVFFELMSTTAFALCGLKVEEPAPLQGSFNFAVTNTVGAFFTLTGIGLLYAATGALNMAQIGNLLGSRHDSLVLIAGLFILSGFLIKAAIFPFHFWLPDAHSVAPTPVCVLFSGLMVELGLYAIVRISTIVFGLTFFGAPSPFRICFLVLGGLTAIGGAVMCFAEHHLKRLLAFSTISHSGIMLFAVALGSPAALAGWLIYVCAHAMIKSGLFFTAGILLHRLRTMSEPALFGRGRPLRFTAVLWLLGACGLAGMFPFSIALAEKTITDAGSVFTSIAAEILLLISGALTAAAVLRVFMRVFCGWGDSGPSDAGAQVDELPETGEENQVVPFRLFGPAAICIAVGIAMTFLPCLRRGALSASQVLLNRSQYIGAIYSHAFSPSDVGPQVATSGIGAHGFLSIALALLFALCAVFHRSLPRKLRWASHLEGRLTWVRRWQSGHPGDYVTYSLVGVAAMGGVFLLVR